jgi:hypothetical protein
MIVLSDLLVAVSFERQRQDGTGADSRAMTLGTGFLGALHTLKQEGAVQTKLQVRSLSWLRW